ncbi:hypothetical protein [Microbacterium sp. GCS4]|uniref:hypothetical protein n=1 Tax=Microbacterium sp. GCS4 TaxID=1692239 RepID=UPI00067FB8C3|nr:hypothetical protein [Microbacterium sp. GCS4]KNY06048.1 hypothetical protein AKH00_09545 [Microbacterium sp. GCS4]
MIPSSCRRCSRISRRRGQAEQLAALTASVSTLVRFTAAEGADGHCQPLARTLTAQRMFDWLDERLA